MAAIIAPTQEGAWTHASLVSGLVLGTLLIGVGTYKIVAARMSRVRLGDRSLLTAETYLRPFQHEI